MSARRAGDVVIPREAIVGFFQKDQVEAELFLPWSAQQQRSRIFANCEVLEERAEEDGAFLRIRSERDAVERLGEQLGRT